jgi:hypothetical protein
MQITYYYPRKGGQQQPPGRRRKFDNSVVIAFRRRGGELLSSGADLSIKEQLTPQPKRYMPFTKFPRANTTNPATTSQKA